MVLAAQVHPALLPPARELCVAASSQASLPRLTRAATTAASGCLIHTSTRRSDAAWHNDDLPPTPTYIDAQSQAVVECGSAWDTLDKA